MAMALNAVCRLQSGVSATCAALDCLGLLAGDERVAALGLAPNRKLKPALRRRARARA